MGRMLTYLPGGYFLRSGIVLARSMGAISGYFQTLRNGHKHPPAARRDMRFLFTRGL